VTGVHSRVVNASAAAGEKQRGHRFGRRHRRVHAIEVRKAITDNDDMSACRVGRLCHPEPTAAEEAEPTAAGVAAPTVERGAVIEGSRRRASNTPRWRVRF
jgi:hypothetical protein